MTLIKKYAKKTIVTAVFILVCFILQTAVFGKLPLGGITPNVLLCLTSFYGFIYGGKEGTVVGFFSGLLLDEFFGEHYGMFALIYLIIGFLNGAVRKQFFGDDVKLPVFLVLLSDIVYGFSVFFSVYLPRGRTDISHYFIQIIMPEAMYTCIISFFLYFIFVRSKEWLLKEEKRSESTYFG